MSDIVWKPSESRKKDSAMFKFCEAVHAKYGCGSKYSEVWKWSVENTGEFWGFLANHLEILWRKQVEGDVLTILDESSHLISARFFEGCTLNYAEHVWQHHSKNLECEAVTSYLDGELNKSYTGRELWNRVQSFRDFLDAKNVVKGDRLAACVVNGIEAIVAFLACASKGVVFSSCSPDFGANAVVDRFSQIRPKVLLMNSEYRYNGKLISLASKIQETVPRIEGLEYLVVIGQGAARTLSKKVAVPVLEFEALTLKSEELRIPELRFEELKFRDMLYILYSSGTTGKPKCIVHGVGGSLIQHQKELKLHVGLNPDDTLLYFTTCGWMMWNWMISGLTCGAKLVTYEGSVGYPNADQLWQVVKKEKVTVFGTSPKYLSHSMKELGGAVIKEENFPALRTILTTGSPLLKEHFEWVYAKFNDIHLASISGGTDIVSCFMLGVPIEPVYSGFIQAAGLGMSVEAWDDNEESAFDVPAELVCTKPFPSMPLCFWDDEANGKYKNAYFDHYQNKEVWHHGDLVSIHSGHLGIEVLGRSDATLNPGGVRIGTAELYRQVENIAEITDSIASGKPENGDSEICLFVKLTPNRVLEPELEAKIRKKIKENLSPRHVPKYIVQVEKIPYTRSGKKVEVALQKIFRGQEVLNLSSFEDETAILEYVKWNEELSSK